MIVGEIAVVTAPTRRPPPGIDFAAALADLRETKNASALERDHARRWWRRIW
jgi:hypothetical protein